MKIFNIKLFKIIRSLNCTPPQKAPHTPPPPLSSDSNHISMFQTNHTPIYDKFSFRTDFFTSPKPLYMDRFVFLVLVVTLNFAAAILGVVFQPGDFPSFLLAVFLINLLAYFAYYVIMKFIHSEVAYFRTCINQILSFSALKVSAQYCS